jgi:hypothetical protein
VALDSCRGKPIQCRKMTRITADPTPPMAKAKLRAKAISAIQNVSTPSPRPFLIYTDLPPIGSEETPLKAGLPSAAQTQRAVFPHWAFTKATYLADAIDGISPIRFTRPISSYRRITSGSSFHPVLRHRLRLWDHIRWTIPRFNRWRAFGHRLYSNNAPIRVTGLMSSIRSLVPTGALRRVFLRICSLRSA